MKHLLYIFCLALLIGCGRHDMEDFYRFSESDPYFDQYKVMFENEYHRYTGRHINAEPVRINFVHDLPPDTIGLCMRGVVTIVYPPLMREKKVLIREIFVNKPYFRKIANKRVGTVKEIVMMHELGHCVLDRGHEDDEFGDEKLSLMNSTLIGSDHYEMYRSAYLEELFTGNKEIVRNEIYNAGGMMALKTDEKENGRLPSSINCNHDHNLEINYGIIER